MQVVFSVNNQGERTAPQQADIADETMFERLNDSDGICQYYVEDQGACVPLGGAGGGTGKSQWFPGRYWW